jgi:hypothetical protein
MAYEVTYSFVSQPLASDEYGNRNFTFQVYFRPDELAPEMRQALSAKKRNRADTVAYFTVNMYREPVRRIAIDEARSHFCDGSFQDGAWNHDNASCTDEISLKAIAVPSDFVTVRVDPVSARPGRAGLVSANAAPRPSASSK